MISAPAERRDGLPAEEVDTDTLLKELEGTDAQIRSGQTMFAGKKITLTTGRTMIVSSRVFGNRQNCNMVLFRTVTPEYPIGRRSCLFDIGLEYFFSPGSFQGCKFVSLKPFMSGIFS